MHLFNPNKLCKLDDPQRLKQISVENIAKHLDLRDGEVLADIGSGTGLFAFEFAKLVMPTGKVIGYDIQKECIAYAVEKQKEKTELPIVFKLNDIGNIPSSDNEFDAVTMLMLAHEISDPDFYKEVYRIMKKGAKLAIVDWQTKQADKGPSLEERISVDALYSLLIGYGFEIVHNENINDYNYLLVVKK